MSATGRRLTSHGVPLKLDSTSTGRGAFSRPALRTGEPRVPPWAPSFTGYLITSPLGLRSGKARLRPPALIRVPSRAVIHLLRQAVRAAQECATTVLLLQPCKHLPPRCSLSPA